MSLILGPFHMTQRIDLYFFEKILIQWNGLFQDSKFFSSKKNSLNWFFWIRPTELNFLWIEPFNFLSMTQRIEPLNFLYDAKIWTLFQNITQRIYFSEKETKIWTFWWIWLKELNSFWKCDSKNWTLFGSMPQRIEHLSFWHDSKFWTFFFLVNTTQRIELFYEYDSIFSEKKLKESKLFLWL